MANDLRPLSLAELLDRTFFLYRRHFLVFVGIVALPNLLSLAFQLMSLTLVEQGTDLSLAILLPFVGLIFVVMPVMAVAQAATVVSVSNIHLGRPITIREAFRAVLGRLLSFIGINIAVGVLITIGFLFCIVPGIIAAFRWSLVVQAAALERVGLGGAMSRSAELTRGAYGKIFLIYFLYMILVFACSAVPEMIFVFMRIFSGEALSVETPPMWQRVVTELGTFLTQCLAAPLLTIAFSLFYYDQRVRKEAFDLEHMMNALDSNIAGAPAT